MYKCEAEFRRVGSCFHQQLCAVVHRSDEDRAVQILDSFESSTEAPLRKDPLHVQLLFAVLVNNCAHFAFNDVAATRRPELRQLIDCEVVRPCAVLAYVKVVRNPLTRLVANLRQIIAVVA